MVGSFVSTIILSLHIEKGGRNFYVANCALQRQIWQYEFTHKHGGAGDSGDGEQAFTAEC